MILVDTGILSLAFRRKRRDLNPAELVLVYALERLLNAGLVAMVGPIRQEIMSGISSGEQFEKLKGRLQFVDDLPMESATFERAAQFYNQCSAEAIGPGEIDMMICAAAYEQGCDIFTNDPDFERYATVLPIRLFRA